MEADAKSVAAAVAFLAEHSRAHANDDNALLYARLHGEVIERYGASGADCPSTDQRSVTRPQGAGCDIGANELEAGAGAAGPTVVPAIDTPTPVPLLPIEVNFNADSYALVEGTCTRLRWEVKNAETVALDGQPVPPLEAEQICPKQTTSYRLVASSTAEQVERLVLIEVTKMAPPKAPEKLAITGQVCTDKAYSVMLGWVDVADNEEGYRVYRDGALIATLGANASGYTDQPAYGGPYTYGVEAYNSTGASARPTVQEPGCIY